MLDSSRLYFIGYVLILFSVTAAIWFLGPQITVFGKYVLASVFNRVMLISLIIVSTEIVRLQPKNIRDSTSFDPKIRAELSLLRNSLSGALKFLRNTKIAVDDNKEWLYKRPWHLLIGPADSGKTALMANSGFKFILSRKNAGKGTKSTRHVDWWVTREAVILDTSSNFTTHGTSPLHKKCWFTLLNWLKRHENLSPMQSVIIALSLGDLIRKSAAEQKKIFEDLHLRLTEIQRTMGHGFKIHILFTKCDLLSGFNAYFETLDGNEREQLWGLVLPATFQKSFPEHVQDTWQQFMKTLQERVLTRMHHERNLQKRAQIKDFPLQIEKAQHIIQELVQHLPPINDAKNKDRHSLHLSGIFFTSTSQREPAFDQLLAPLSESFALAKYDDAIIVNPELNYFTRQLFQDVIFEGAKVNQWKQEIAFQQGLRYGMYTAATALVVMGTIVLVQSFQGQLQDIDQAKKAITEYQLLAKQAQEEPSLKSLLPALDALDRAQFAVSHSPRKLIKDVNASHQHLPDLMQQSYDKTVVTTIIPKLKTDVEQQLGQMLALQQQNRIGYLYTTLKVHQMLANPEHVDVDVIERWLGQFWYENNIGNTKQLGQLKPHIAKAFAKLKQPIKIDNRLGGQAKLLLNQLSESQLAQAILDDMTHNSKHQPIQLPIALTESDEHPFHGPSSSIPYLYTHQGFVNGFVSHYQKAADEALHGNWVLGAKLPPQSAKKQLEELENQLASDYATAYINAWQTVLDKTRFVSFYSLTQAKKALSNLPAGESDLSKIVVALQTHTQFSRLDEPTAATKLAAKEIQTHFRALNDRLVQHPEHYLENVLNRLQQALVLMTRTADDVDASFQFAKVQFSGKQSLMSQIQYGIEELPKPLQVWFDGFVNDFWSKILDSSAEYVQQQWKTMVWKEYEKNIANHYPLVRNAHKAMSTETFSQFYGPQGKIAQFFKSNVNPFLSADQSGVQYWTSIANQQIPLSDQLLKIADRLDIVKKQFFHGNTLNLEINFSLIANALSPTIKNFAFNMDGHKLEYPNGATSLGNVRWPNPRARHHDVSVSIKTDQDANKSMKETGPWALFKFLDKATLESTKDPKRYILTINLDKHALKYELVADSKDNPFTQKIFAQLELPQEI